MLFTRLCLYTYIVAVVSGDPTIDERIWTPGEGGEDVTIAVIDQVQMIFRDDNRFMARIACVESSNGLNPNTYREGYYGGIFQVDRIGFEDTQNVASHPGLTAKFASIEEAFGINWLEVEYEDLVIPFISAIAARLFISNIPEPIPTDRTEQAHYWKEHYNTVAGTGNPDDFPSDKKRRQTDNDEADIADFIDFPSCVCRSKLLRIHRISYTW